MKLGRDAAAVQRDEHEKAMTEDRAKFERNDPMDVNDTKQPSWSEAEKSGAADTMHKRLLEQMEWLCRSEQDVGNRMESKIEHEGLKRHQENQKLNEEMYDRMDEGFKNEEIARKLVQNALVRVPQITQEIADSACASTRHAQRGADLGRLCAQTNEEIMATPARVAENVTPAPAATCAPPCPVYK